MRIFEKVPHSEENVYGIHQIEEGDNPFAGPCAVVFLAAEGYSSSIKPLNGAIKKTMEMSRLTTSENPNARYNIEDFPVRFLGIHCASNKKSNFKNFNELASKYIEPLLTGENGRVPKEEAMRVMRNINLVSYCAGIQDASFKEDGKGLEKEADYLSCDGICTSFGCRIRILD